MPVTSMSIDRQVMRDCDHGNAEREHGVGPKARAPHQPLAVGHVQILGHLRREHALVLDVVAIDEDRNDQCGEREPGLERPGAVDVRPESHEGEIDERQYGAGRGRSMRWIQPAFRFRKLKMRYPIFAAPMMNTVSESSKSSRLNPILVSMALVGAPCAFTLARYFGSQPSSYAWYRMRQDPP